MNELVFVSNRYNVISAQFIRHGKPSGTIYAWYLPYNIQKYLCVGDIVLITIHDRKQSIIVQSLSYDSASISKYKSFPYQNGQPSWQIRQICGYLKKRGYVYQREKHFKKLVNRNGTTLGVDVAFKVQGHWCFIEYNGTHHYYRDSPRYANIAANMLSKRQWAYKNNVPMLEIPYWWQNDLDSFVSHFLKIVKRDLSITKS